MKKIASKLPSQIHIQREIEKKMLVFFRGELRTLFYLDLNFYTITTLGLIENLLFIFLLGYKHENAIC